ncbi:MAG TPA: type II toxin-antitoxin system HicB family antitoxin [Tepidisphaeraceae bacterium]|jgi:predicted RNase H-like HicB family nuclease|nr:type II toxin-antitoxin system HicB family antitoxin [Tepidisphaeraceae bacterium]
MTSYTAVIQRDGKWWIGWVAEIEDVNSQGRTRASLLANLASALKEAIAIAPARFIASMPGKYEEVTIDV